MWRKMEPPILYPVVVLRDATLLVGGLWTWSIIFDMYIKDFDKKMSFFCTMVVLHINPHPPEDKTGTDWV